LRRFKLVVLTQTFEHCVGSSALPLIELAGIAEAGAAVRGEPAGAVGAGAATTEQVQGTAGAGTTEREPGGRCGGPGLLDENKSATAGGRAWGPRAPVERRTRT
jgi:hypothetical protein